MQRNGRIDRIGSPHAEIGIYNMFPEAELEALLHLIERLTDRISTIDDLGLLDASVLGEVVHPRTFNTLRRIRDEDGTVLDEEEARAELAGPEVLLKQLKDMLNRDGSSTSWTTCRTASTPACDATNCHGMFFYFQAPRSDGEGRRHFWRYIDARTHEVKENRYEIAQVIACQPDEPRYIGDQDVFVLQEQGDRAHPGGRARGRGQGGGADRRGSDPADGDRGDQGRHPPPDGGPGSRPRRASASSASRWGGRCTPGCGRLTMRGRRRGTTPRFSPPS